jgi:hypothetical protein
VLGRCRSLKRSSSGEMFGAGNGVVFLLERLSFWAFCGGNWFRIDLDFEQKTCAELGTSCSCPWCLRIHGTRVLDMQEKGGMEIEKL